MRLMESASTLSRLFYSHPDKLYSLHIKRMLCASDTKLEKCVKIHHDIAKLKESFQTYIQDTTQKIQNKNHSLLSAYIFLQNADFESIDRLFGFLAILSHHGEVGNFYDELLKDSTNLGDNYLSSVEFNFYNETINNAKSTKMQCYNDIFSDIEGLKATIKEFRLKTLAMKFTKKFTYEDFINFKKLYADLIYCDKYEAIFNQEKSPCKNIDISVLESNIENLPYSKKRSEFREFVLSNFDENHKLFTLTAPTGYGKTLTALNFALKFKKERVIFALPFTSIVDQTYKTIDEIYQNSDLDIYKIHHKTTIDESIPEDRYSKLKFLMNSFSADINITTQYQLIYALFGNKNKDNVKFNQLKNSVVIIDEAQALPYEFRKDFMKLCEIISDKLNTVFIFMSATMPVISSSRYKEISNLEFFKNQNRYKLEWLKLEDGENSLVEKIKIVAKEKHTLVVVNTIKKAQELYVKFAKFKRYCINGYMTDGHKQKVIEEVQKALKGDEKIILISTQSIEAGVDVSFEVGFREIAPISSIIQTAGRINRNFAIEQSTLYVFEDISGYSDKIYGDLGQISKTILELLKETAINECDILDFSQIYFCKIHAQLEKLLVEKEIKTLEFKTINAKINEVMDSQIHKKLIIVEQEVGFVKKLESKFFQAEFNGNDKFQKRDFIEKLIKDLTTQGVNVSKSDIEKFQTNLEPIKFAKDIYYLPFGSQEYDNEIGIKKIEMPNQDCFS